MFSLFAWFKAINQQGTWIMSLLCSMVPSWWMYNDKVVPSKIGRQVHKHILHNSPNHCESVCKEPSQSSAQLEATTGFDISTVNISCYFSVASGLLAGSSVNFDSPCVLWSQLSCTSWSAGVPWWRGTAWEPFTPNPVTHDVKVDLKARFTV